MAGDELVTILGVELSPAAMANIRKFKTGIDSVMSQMKTLGLVATGMVAAAGIVINRAVDEASAMQVLSDKTGVSTTALQEWSYAAGQVGVDAKSVQNDLVSMTKSMSSPIPGQFNVNLAMIGVSARNTNGSLKDSSQILEDLGGKLASMDAQKAMQWGSKIGISDDTVLLLRQGKEGLAKLRAEAHELGAIIPSDAIKRAAEFKTQINSLQAVLKSLTSQIAIATLPALSRVVEMFKGWIAENRKWIMLHTESFMTGLVSAFERVWGAVKKVLEIFQPLVDWFKKSTEGISRTEMYTHLLTGAMTGLLIIFAPILAKLALLGAAVVFVSGVIEDFFGYLNGEDSAIGYIFEKMAEKFPGIAKLFSSLKKLAVDLFEGALGPGKAILETLGKAFTEIFTSWMGVLDGVANRAADFIDGFADKFPAIVDAVSSLAGVIKTVLGGAFDALIGTIKLFHELAREVFGWLFDALEKGASGLNSVLEWAGFGGKKGDKPTPPKPEGYDDTKYGSVPTSTPSPALMRASHDVTRPATTLAPGGAGPMITDNRTVVQHINTTDPVQAGNIAAQRAGGSYTQLTNPGLNAPVVR